MQTRRIADSFCLLLLSVISPLIAQEHIQEEVEVFIDGQSAQPLEEMHEINYPLQLMNYLKGEWKSEGYMQIPDIGGKKLVKASFSGTEKYELDLDNHFLQKNFECNLSFYSLKKRHYFQKKLSVLEMFAFSSQLQKFFLWYFDSEGATFELTGDFVSKKKEYRFASTFVNKVGKRVDVVYAINPIDSNKYKWTKKEKDPGSRTFRETASGISIRNSP